MINLDIIDDHNYLSQEQEVLLRNITNLAAQTIGNNDDCELDVSIVDLEEIRVLNQQYRNIDRPTDVLSFALEESLADDLFSQIYKEEMHLPRHLGDVVICYQKILEQAESYGHSIDRELGFLMVHGFLHVNGYDHQTPEEEATMFGIQEEVLLAYGLSR